MAQFAGSTGLFQRPTYRKWLTLVGSMLLIMPGGVDWFWGNVSVYVLSYLLSRNPLANQIDETWVIAVYNTCWISGLLLSGPISRNMLSRRWLMVIGIALLHTGVFLSYFSIHRSLLMLTITLSFLVGISEGVLLGNGLHLIIETADTDQGFLSSVFLSATSIGGVTTSQICTWFVNPENETPNLKLGSMKYFSQKNIVEKVPSFLLVLLGLSLSMHLIGLLLLQANPATSFVNFFSTTKLEDIFLRFTTSEKHSINLIKNKKENLLQRPSDAKNTITLEPSKSQELTPTQMLQTSTFYALWISIFIGEISHILLLNFYKLYGQLWIKDDHFLTNLGMTFMVVISLSRVPWGLSLDKLGPKHCLMILLGSTALIASWYCFTAMLHPWLYVLATLLYGVFSGPSSSIFIATAGLLFGKSHMTTNTGLLLLACVAANLAAPFMIDLVFTSFGWFTVFIVGGSLDIVGFLLCLFFVP